MAKRSKGTRSKLSSEAGLEDSALAGIVGGVAAATTQQKQTDDAHQAITASVVAAAMTQAEQHAATPVAASDPAHAAIDTNHSALDAANLAHAAQQFTNPITVPQTPAPAPHAPVGLPPVVLPVDPFQGHAPLAPPADPAHPQLPSAPQAAPADHAAPAHPIDLTAAKQALADADKTLAAEKDAVTHATSLLTTDQAKETAAHRDVLMYRAGSHHDFAVQAETKAHAQVVADQTALTAENVKLQSAQHAHDAAAQTLAQAEAQAAAQAQALAQAQAQAVAAQAAAAASAPHPTVAPVARVADVTTHQPAPTLVQAHSVDVAAVPQPLADAAAALAAQKDAVAQATLRLMGDQAKETFAQLPTAMFGGAGGNATAAHAQVLADQKALDTENAKLQTAQQNYDAAQLNALGVPSVNNPLTPSPTGPAPQPSNPALIDPTPPPAPPTTSPADGGSSPPTDKVSDPGHVNHDNAGNKQGRSLVDLVRGTTPAPDPHAPAAGTTPKPTIDPDTILNIQFADATGTTSSLEYSAAGAGVSATTSLGPVTLTTTAGANAAAGVTLGPLSADVAASVGVGASANFDFGHGVSMEVGVKAGGAVDVHVGVGAQLVKVTATGGVGAYASVEQTQSGSLGGGVTGSETVTLAAVVGATGGATAAFGLTNTGAQAGGAAGFVLKAGETANLDVGGVSFSQTLGVYSPGSLAADASAKVGYSDGKINIGFNISGAIGIGGVSFGANIGIDTAPIVDTANTVGSHVKDTFDGILGIGGGGESHVLPAPSVAWLTHQQPRQEPVMSVAEAQSGGRATLDSAHVTFPSDGIPPSDPHAAQALHQAAVTICNSQSTYSMDLLQKTGDHATAQLVALDLLTGAYDTIAKNNLTGDAAALQIAAAKYYGAELVAGASSQNATVAYREGQGTITMVDDKIMLCDPHRPIETLNITPADGSAYLAKAYGTDVAEYVAETQHQRTHPTAVQQAQTRLDQLATMIELDKALLAGPGDQTAAFIAHLKNETVLAPLSDAQKPMLQQMLAEHQAEAVKAMVDVHLADGSWQGPSSTPAQAAATSAKEITLAGQDFPGPGFQAQTGPAAQHLLNAAEQLVSSFIGHPPLHGTPVSAADQAAASYLAMAKGEHVAAPFGTDLIEAAYATISARSMTGADAQRLVAAAVYYGEHEFMKTNPNPQELAQYQLKEATQLLQHDQNRLATATGAEAAVLTQTVAKDQLALMQAQVAVQGADVIAAKQVAHVVDSLSGHSAEKDKAEADFLAHLYGRPVPPPPPPESAATPQQLRDAFLTNDGPAPDNLAAWHSNDAKQEANAARALSGETLPARPGAEASFADHAQYANDVLKATYATVVAQHLSGTEADKLINAALYLGKAAMMGTSLGDNASTVAALCANQAQTMLQIDQWRAAVANDADRPALETKIAADLAHLTKFSSEVRLLDPSVHAQISVADIPRLLALEEQRHQVHRLGPVDPNMFWPQALAMPPAPKAGDFDSAMSYANTVVELAYAKIASDPAAQTQAATTGLLNAAHAAAQQAISAVHPSDLQVAQFNAMSALQTQAHDKLAAACTAPADRGQFNAKLAADDGAVRETQLVLQAWQDTAKLSAEAAKWGVASAGNDAAKTVLHGVEQLLHGVTGAPAAAPIDAADTLSKLHAADATTNAATLKLADAVLAKHSAPQPAASLDYARQVIDSAYAYIDKAGLTGQAAELQIEGAKVRADAAVHQIPGSNAQTIAAFHVSEAQQILANEQRRMVIADDAHRPALQAEVLQASADLAKAISVQYVADPKWTPAATSVADAQAQYRAALAAIDPNAAGSDAAALAASQLILKGQPTPPPLPHSATTADAEKYAHDVLELAYATVSKNGLTGAVADLQIKAAMLFGDNAVQQTNPTPLALAQFHVHEAFQGYQHAQQNALLAPNDQSANKALAGNQAFLLSALDQVYAHDPSVIAAVKSGDATTIAQAKAMVAGHLLAR